VAVDVTDGKVHLRVLDGGGILEVDNGSTITDASGRDC
jgi:hypothetical protein